MGIDFRHLFYAGIACGVVSVILVGTVAGILYNRGETIDVHIGTVVMEDAGVQR